LSEVVICIALRLILLSLAIPFSVSAIESITLVDSKERIEQFSVEIIEDKESSWSVEQANKQTNWQVGSNQFSLGYSTSTFWIRFSVQNPSKQNKQLHLLFSESFLKHVNLYQLTGSGWLLKENGSNVLIEHREVAHHYPGFLINFDAEKTTHFVFQIKSDFGVFGQISLLKNEAFYHTLSKNDAIHIFMFGAISIIALYNLFLWINLRDSIYFHYVAYIVAFLLWLSTYSGHIQYIVPPKLYNSVNVVLPIAFLFLILFTQRLLITRKVMPKLDKVLTYMAIGFAITAIFIPFKTSISFQAQNVLAIFLLPLLLFIGIMGIHYRVSNARVYTAALLLYFIGFVILGLMALGILPYNYFTRYAPFPGSLLEITLFSFALASRINQHKQQAIDAQTDLLLMQESANKELEQKVRERTQKLHEQKKQLEHLSLTDSLTNIYNRRAFRDIFEDTSANLSYGQHLTLLMLDIDFFKRYNDRYGHQAGDNALIAIADVLISQAENLSGNAFRLGGEEFALLFFSESDELAVEAAEKCRKSIFELDIKNESSRFGVISASIGLVVASKDNYFTMAQMYKHADHALYQAKGHGRNKVVLSEAR